MALCGRSSNVWIWLLALATCIGSPAGARADNLAARVVIVYNVADPDSRPLADYYAMKRGVPTNQVCRLNVRDSETITRQEYNDGIRDPIWKFLTQQGLLQQEPRTIFDSVLGKIPGLVTIGAKVSYVVLMYGVPLRIDSDPNVVENLPENTRKEFRRNEASVESELATLPTSGLPISGFVRNPFFGRFSGEFEPPLNQEMLLVGRLDGPDPETVRRMIDDSLTAERYGLQGRGYFDWEDTHDRGLLEGDEWIRGAYQACVKAGYECDFDDRPETFGEDYPMTDAAMYAGWYSPNVVGPFLRPDFRFKTGAVAYHLHSWSGSSVRTRTAYWVGPLLAKGAAASLGNVFEPYLSATPHIDMFFQRLLDGGTFLEAGYYSEPVLSWQTTFVGDPLYRPFAASLDEQIRRLTADHKPDLEWAYLRKINLLINQSDVAAAEKLCRGKAEALGSAVLYEKLGDMLHKAGRDAEAIQAYAKADEKPVDAWHHIRVATKMATAYEANHQPAKALGIYEDLASTYSSHHNAVDFYKRARELAGELGDGAKVKLWQAKIDELTAPPKPAGQQETK